MMEKLIRFAREHQVPEAQIHSDLVDQSRWYARLVQLRAPQTILDNERLTLQRMISDIGWTFDEFNQYMEETARPSKPKTNQPPAAAKMVYCSADGCQKWLMPIGSSPEYDGLTEDEYLAMTAMSARWEIIDGKPLCRDHKPTYLSDF